MAGLGAGQAVAVRARTLPHTVILVLLGTTYGRGCSVSCRRGIWDMRYGKGWVGRNEHSLQ